MELDYKVLLDHFGPVYLLQVSKMKNVASKSNLALACCSSNQEIFVDETGKVRTGKYFVKNASLCTERVWRSMQHKLGR